MRKPVNIAADDQSLLTQSVSVPTRKSGQGISGCSLTSQRADFVEDNHPRHSHKLRDGSAFFNFHRQNIMLPSCVYPNKVPTIINFDFKQNSAIRNRKMEIPGINALLEGIHNPGGRNHRLDTILGSASTGSRSKETSKHIRKDSLDSCRCSQGSCSHHHQDGTYSSTTFKEQENNLQHSSDSYVDKPTKKQSKIHKTRHPSKSIAMNLNDMIVGKKKSKSKRPLTGGASELNSEDSICSPKINARVYSSTNKISKRDKENLPPIVKQGQNQANGNYGQSEKEDSSHSGCSIKNCSKCNTMAQKLKSQVQVAKTLQRQNGCLENIVTQKRNLVEQLTRQVRTLVRENQQLSKGCGKLPLETMLSTESASATSLQKIQTLNVLGCTGSLGSLQVMENYEDEESEDLRKTRAPKERLSSQSAREVRKPQKTDSIEKLEQAEQQLSTLSLKYESMQQNFDHLQKENQEINRFLTDLLYTLNARGYESITDHEGNTIDLYRCKGDTFLDLKGRDARLRAPAKRLAPQETLLKAVIGSQERIIQNLISQLEDHQKEALLGKRLSLDNFNGEEGNRNAAIEGEVLTLVGLLEGACQRNPDVLTILRDQHTFDSQVKAHSGLAMGNAIVEAVLERCQKVISTLPPPLPATTVKRRQRDFLNPRSGTPPPFQPKLGSNTADNVSRPQIYSDNSNTSILPPSSANNGGQRTNSNSMNSNKQGTVKSENELSLSKEVSQPTPRQQMLPEISVRVRLPQLSRSSAQNQNQNPPGVPLSPVRTNTANLMPNGISPRSTPRLRPNLTDNRVGQSLPSPSTTNSTTIPPMQKLSENPISCLNGDRCPYCSRQFSSATSLAEINAHMEMHAYQAG